MLRALRGHNTTVRVYTSGYALVEYPCILPDVFDEILLAYIHDTPLLTFPNNDHHILDERLVLRDCTLSVGDTTVYFRGVLLNESIANVTSMSWNGDWRLDILPYSTYIYRSVPGGVVDQGDAGTCGVVTVCEALGRTIGETLSPLFLYYTTRVGVENAHPGRDSGVSLLDTLLAIGRWGVCRESMWPYRLEMLSTRPDAAAYADAATRRVVDFDIVTGETSLKRELSAGRWIVADVHFPTSAFSESVALNGLIPEREFNTRSYSHSIILTEWLGDLVKFRNSYGGDWGDGGVGYLPVSYIRHGYVENCIVFK